MGHNPHFEVGDHVHLFQWGQTPKYTIQVGDTVKGTLIPCNVLVKSGKSALVRFADGPDQWVDGRNIVHKGHYPYKVIYGDHEQLALF